MTAPMLKGEPLPTTDNYDDLLRRGIATARYFTPTADGADADNLAARILDLPDWDRERLAHVLSRALTQLVEPGRVGDLTGLASDLAGALFDDAHEHCDDETGCTGGGRPYYTELVEQVVMPVVREHAVPAAEVSGNGDHRG